MKQDAVHDAAATDAPAATRPWTWVPSLYFAQGVPYVVVMTVSVIMYKRLGISNADIALYTSWLYLPWVLKPLWSPFVDMYRTKRLWVVVLQLLLGASFAAVALTLPGPAFFRVTLGVFWLLAFSSATHDIAADGFYMLGLQEHEQAAFAGVRTTFFRLAMITAQGLLVVVAGSLEEKLGVPVLAWSITFGIIAAAMLALGLYHRVVLPRPAADHPMQRAGHGPKAALEDFVRVFAAFFRKPGIVPILLFLLFYRFAEAQLAKMVMPFLLDGRAQGGLGLTTTDVGKVYGTVGVIALLVGGITGGVAISRHGLRRWLWPMVLMTQLPDLVYVYLSQAQPESLAVVMTAVALEQLGYGFGFTAYIMFMILVSEGENKTAHYALCTGIMALGMMLPGMVSGTIQEALGYPTFFVWIIVSTIPAFIVPALVRIPARFGAKGA